jgi:glycerophosphoryl diester phosphodiesterase
MHWTIQTMNQNQAQPWPYPRWIAHRGAGKLAPENTLPAFELGARFGYRMFECDVKLSADGVPFLLHDATLQRTTNANQRLASGASAVAGDHAWTKLAQLDAGSWHSADFVGTPLPTLAQIADFCLKHGALINLEIKATPGLQSRTGEVVANHAAQLWKVAAVPPLLSSFDVPSLEGALLAQPTLPRALLLEELWPGWLETAQRLRCVGVVCDQVLWDASTMAQGKAAGLRCLSYTVNDASEAQRLLALGIDCLITDRVDAFKPDA